MFHLRLVHKVFLALLGTSLLVVVLATLIARWGFERNFRAYTLERDQARLELLATALAETWELDEGWSGLEDNRRAYNRILRGSMQRNRAQDRNDQEPGRLGGRSPTPHGNPPWRRDGGGGGRGGHQPPTLLDAQEHWVAGPPPPTATTLASSRIPVQVQGNTVGWLVAAPTPGLSTPADQALQRQQLFWVASAAAVAMLVAALVAIPLARSLTRRILVLATAARHLTSGQRHDPVPHGHQDELDQLAQDFNHLAASLARAGAARRDWMADISHELRTPLAVAQAELQAMQDGVRPLNLAGLDSLGAELQRLNALVDDLYQLALSDLGALDYRMQPLDLAELVQATLDTWQARLDTAKLRVQLSRPDAALPVLADRARLEQVLGNLLQNSIHYTDAGGQVQLNLSNTGSHARLQLADSAPGVPADTLEHLFERMYRVEGSRNRSTGGAGLGLALVHTICSAHGGQVQATASGLGGLAVTLELPLAAPASSASAAKSNANTSPP